MLLAVIQGLPAPDLTEVAAAAQLPVETLLPLLSQAPADLAASIAGLRPADLLRQLGLAVDQRALCLRPSWRSDDAQLHLLRARPSGAAAVTLLELNEPLLQAALHGPESPPWREAVARLPARLTTACEHLRDGDEPEVWLLATAAAVPVQQTFDLGAALRRRFPWPFGGRRRLALLPELARIETASERARQRLVASLQQEPFRRYGECVQGAHAAETWFAARDGIAFGRRPWRGRRALTSMATALLPVPVRTANALDVNGLVGRFCMRAVELLREPLPAPTQRPQPALPDLAAALAAIGPA